MLKYRGNGVTRLYWRWLYGNKITRRRRSFTLRFNRGRKSLILVFIACLTFRELYISADIPLRLSGVPVSTLGKSPRTYFGVNTRFVLFNSWYGQLNNQILSLINAILITRDVDGVLVLPCEKLGKESMWDNKDTKYLHSFSMRELFGAYFNYSFLASHVPVVGLKPFLESSDGQELQHRRTVVTERKSGGFYRFLFTGQPRKRDLPNKFGMKVWSPSSTSPRLSNPCDFRASKALSHMQKIWQRDRFILLPSVFRQHNLNCTVKYPEWLGIRRWIRPNDEFLFPIDQFLRKIEHPMLSIHLRFFMNGDIGHFTPSSFIRMVEELYSDELENAKTLYVAYTPSSSESVGILNMLKDSFVGEIVSVQDITKTLSSTSRHIVEFPLYSVIMDMWMCVKSDIFIGRLGSSLSWNVVYWRQVLRGEYGLDYKYTENPMWYSLENFTTTGAVRMENEPFYES